MDLMASIRNAAVKLFDRGANESHGSPGTNVEGIAPTTGQIPSPESMFSTRSHQSTLGNEAFGIRNAPFNGNWTLLRVRDAPSTYSSADIWYDRLAHLELRCIMNSPSGDGSEMTELREISILDFDCRVSGLADAMKRSLKEAGDFSRTEPFLRFQAENERLTLQLNPENPYKPEDIWYDRKEKLQALAGIYARTAPPAWMASDLLAISQKEDDHRIVELSRRMLDSLERSGNLSGGRKRGE